MNRRSPAVAAATILVNGHPAIGSFARVLDWNESAVSFKQNAIDTGFGVFPGAPVLAQPKAIADHAIRAMLVQIGIAHVFPEPALVSPCPGVARSLRSLKLIEAYHAPRLRFGAGQNGADHLAAEDNRALFHRGIS